MTVEKINNIELYFDPKMDFEVEIKRRVLSAYEKNRIFFDYSLTNKHSIHIIYSRQEMNDVWGKETESWMVGTATRDGSIYIFSPKIFSEVSSHPASNFDPILTHELAHIFTDEVSKFYQPVWLKEGIAGHIAEQFKNKLPKNLDAFEKLYNKKDWWHHPNYAQASLFTTFLIEKLGKEHFLKFLNDLSQNNDAQEDFDTFSKLFRESVDNDFNQISENWQKKCCSSSKLRK